jgi:cytochrome bd-type quinol oxidase subunit 2
VGRIALVLSVILLAYCAARAEESSARASVEGEVAPRLAQIGLVCTVVSAACAVGSISALLRDDPNTTTGALTVAAAVPTAILGIAFMIKSENEHDKVLGALFAGVGVMACIVGMLNITTYEPDNDKVSGPLGSIAAPTLTVVGVTVGF